MLCAGVQSAALIVTVLRGSYSRLEIIAAYSTVVIDGLLLVVEAAIVPKLISIPRGWICQCVLVQCLLQLGILGSARVIRTADLFWPKFNAKDRWIDLSFSRLQYSCYRCPYLLASRSPLCTWRTNSWFLFGFYPYWVYQYGSGSSYWQERKIYRSHFSSSLTYPCTRNINTRLVHRYWKGASERTFD